MDRLSALSRGTQVMLGASILLLVDTLLPWQRVSVEIGGVEAASASANAWHGFWGVGLGLLTIATIAWLVVRIASVDLPLPVSDTVLAVALGAAVLVFAVLKLLTDSHSTVWAYLGVLLAIGVAAGAFLRMQEAGGMDTLRAEMPARQGSETAPPAEQRPPETAHTQEPPPGPSPAGGPPQEPPPSGHGS